MLAGPRAVTHTTEFYALWLFPKLFSRLNVSAAHKPKMPKPLNIIEGRLFVKRRRQGIASLFSRGKVKDATLFNGLVVRNSKRPKVSLGMDVNVDVPPVRSRLPVEPGHYPVRGTTV